MSADKLRIWAEEIRNLGGTLQNLRGHQKIFQSLKEIVRANPNLQQPSELYNFILDTYEAYAASAIRRLVKPHRQSISLVGLLTDIADNATLLDRKFHRSLYPDPIPDEIAEESFTRWAETALPHVDPQQVRRDIEKIKQSSNKIEAFADKHIAHRDREPSKVIPKYEEVDECIDVLDGIYCKYFSLLTGESIESVTPTIQHDWKAVLRVPWIEGHESG